MQSRSHTPIKLKKKGIVMSYSTTADYTKVLGGKNLPFLVELVEANCIFNPEPGGNQRFCYKITAKSGVSNTEDLKYFILRIDESITASQIKNISVVINGSKKTVRFNTGTENQNVTLNKSGLIFDFGLSKSSGNVMEICFELTSVFEVGEMPIGLYGSDAKKTGLTIGGPCPFGAPGDGPLDDEEEDDEPDKMECKKKCFEINACKVFAVKVFELSVPVSIQPVVITHTPEVKCLGELKIEPGTKECQCHDECGEINFTLTQKISVKTPVDFIVNECYGKLCVEGREDEDVTCECED